MVKIHQEQRQGTRSFAVSAVYQDQAPGTQEQLVALQALLKNIRSRTP